MTMEIPEDIQAEIGTLRDLADDTETDLLRPYRGATSAQLGRISEVFRRVLGETRSVPRLVRVRAIAQLYGYDPQRFRTTEQLSIKGAGAFITWAFVPHLQDVDLDTVPLRESAIATIRWAIDAARTSILPAEIVADAERNRARQRQHSKERRERKKREAASLRTQGQSVTA
jgi:hypothetical protein